MTRRDSQNALVTPVLVAGCLILMISFAVRSGFGLFQIPIQEEFGWLRTEFSLAIAIQNLAWGIGQPIFGAIAEKTGDRKAIILGAVLYAAGLVLSAGATASWQHHLLEIAVGFGIAGTGFGVILAIVSRAASDANRSMALALATAAGSAGQVFGPPGIEWLLGLMPITPGSVLVFSAVMGALWLATVPLTSGLVAHIHGLRYMGTLYGFVFLSHQFGSFLGVWLGGRMYDITGDHTLVWWVGIGVGAFSAIVHLPVREIRAPVAIA